MSEHASSPVQVTKNLLGLNPSTYRDKEFLAKFRAMAELDTEDALIYLVEQLPAMLASNLNRKEKLNHLLFMPRLIQKGGNVKHGVEKLRRKANSVLSIHKKHGGTMRGAFVDVGCGAHDPIALAMYMYGIGFERGLANDMQPARNELYSALSLLDILAQLNLMPTRFVNSSFDPKEFTERIRGFNIDQLVEGNFLAGIQPMSGKVDFEVCDIVDSRLSEAEAAMICSFAVFEHVMDIEGVTRYLYSRTAPGGLGFHFIDLRDHRAYRRTGEFNEFSFLTEENGPANLNRIRKSDQIRAFKEAGFDILSAEGERAAVPAETKAKLLRRFAKMPEEDIDTVSLSLVVRRPLDA